jgi:hypothetical protein
MDPGYPPPVPTAPPARTGLEPRRLWAGGFAAALVAAGVAVVGYLLVYGILGFPIVGVKRGGAVVQPTMFGYAATAFLGAIVAVGIAHLLLLTTPRPRSFFNWIMVLATLAAMLLPLALDESAQSRVATAGVNMAIGITIGVLVSMSVEASLRPLPTVAVPPQPGHPPQSGHPPQGYPPAGYPPGS